MTMYVKAEDEEVLVFKQHEVICEPSVFDEGSWCFKGPNLILYRRMRGR